MIGSQQSWSGAWRPLPVMVLVAVLAACGGGGSGTAAAPTTPTPPPSPPDAAGSGINGGGLAMGAITGFGSIFVNGVEFSTSSSTVRIEGASGTAADLKLGQIVVVQGPIATDGRSGTANTVSYDDNAEGRIEAVSLVDDRLVVAGQTARVTGTTVFAGTGSPAGLGALAVGDTVEISGLPDSTGLIVATRIERKPAAAESEATGRVERLDGAQRRFAIGALTVDYAAATLVNGTPANGACVEAKGAIAATVMSASRVEVKNCTPAASANERGEIEGEITRFATSSDFDVGAQRVATTGTTTYANGTAAGLRADVRVEVEGTFTAAGVLTATRVEFKPESHSRLLGTVDAVTASTLTVFGVVATPNAATFYVDASAARLPSFRLTDVRVGDYVEVRGFVAPAGGLVATRIERDDLAARREIAGPPSAIARPELTVLGVRVVTGATTEFRDAAGATMTADAYFAAAPTRIVRARGTWTGSVFNATQCELENP